MYYVCGHADTRFLEERNMRYFPTGEQMRRADKYTIEKIGIPSLVLMERAALECVRCMEEEKLDFSNVLIVCGSGNNGGDGYAIARLLYLKGYRVSVFFAGKEDSRSDENIKQKDIAAFYQIPIVDTLEDKYTVIVDAIFGTGLKRDIEGKYFEIIRQLNDMQGQKVAIDIPSGVQDKNGIIMGIAFQADYTIAIAFIKRGCLFFPGASYAGKILIGNIGITEHALSKDEKMTFGYEFSDLQTSYPKRTANSHKGTYGKVLFVVGSKGMSGAAYLCAKAAYVVGAGLVQIYTHEDNRVILQQLLPEAIVTTYTAFEEEKLAGLVEWADVIGIGSGLGTNSVSEQIVSFVLSKSKKSCVVDADALNILAKHAEYEVNCECIFTPHMKEMSRLTGKSLEEISKKRMDILEAFVAEKRGVCVLKDARTVVWGHGTEIYLNTTGNAAMAKGGSGDVLTGMITGILAQGTNSFKGACLAVYLHGLAGDYARTEYGAYSVFASDLIDSIHSVLKQI